MTKKQLRVRGSLKCGGTNLPALAIAACSILFAAAGHAQTAAYAGLDTTTQGNWIGHYGADGCTVLGGEAATPTYSGAVSVSNATATVTKSLSAQDVTDLRAAAARAILQEGPNAGNDAVAADFNVRYAVTALYQSPAAQDRVMAAWHSAASPGSSLTVDVPLKGAKVHQVALYFLDINNGSRFETVRAENAATGAVLASHRISYFSFGQYLLWNVSGHVKFVVVHDGGDDAVISGVFFDPAELPVPSALLGEISVSQYGAAADGRTDNTSAFQKALNAAGRTGAIVKVPAGQYYFGSKSNPNPALAIPAQVVLEGVNAGEQLSRSTSAETDQGTVLLVGGGANSTTPFLSLNSNSALRGVTLYYPHQPLSTTPGWDAPTPYPPTIYLGGDNATVDSVRGVNPYVFLVKSLDGSSVRTNVRHVGGQALFRGMISDADPDVTHYEDIHFGESWDSGPKMTAWMLANAWGISVYRGDDLKYTDCSAAGYSRGFYFGFSHLPNSVDLVRGRSGPYSGGLQGCSGVNCRYGVWIDASRQDTDITFHGCAFSSNPDTNGCAVMISNNVDTNGNVTFSGCRFWQAQGHLFVNQARVGGNITVIGCSFDRWGIQSAGLDPASAAIACGDQSNPSAPSAKTAIVDCTFGIDQYTYTSTPGVQGILFEGCTTVSGAHVEALK